ncbi:MAG: sugar ABC transporter permease [Clostridia bacterium]|nr:sugar ABC transporter permease [Clostridia bacterium]
MRYFKTTRKSAKRTIVDVCIYVFLAIISIVWLFPFLYLIVTSLRGESTAIVSYLFPKQWSLDNYIWLLSDPKSNFISWYINTLLIAIVVSLINTLITLLTAYALSRMRFKGRQGLMKFMLILGMFPGFLGMICIYYILNAMGLIGTNMSIVGLMLVYVSGSMMGYYVSKGFFDTIPKSLDEAAMIDGASRSKIFFSIILPLSKPIIIQTLLGAFVAPWGDYMMANYIVGRGGSEFQTVAIGLYQMIDSNQKMTDHFTHFCAGGVLVSILPIVLFFFMQRYYVSGITGGSVKG